MKSLVAHKTIP